MPAAKSDAAVKPATDLSASAPDAKKDQTRLPDAAKPAAAKTDPATSAAPKRTGQIAVFISRKDSKLYVRQNFAPLFDAPVTIAPSDRPLGTHVFTAEIDKNDANVVHWSVVSLPTPSRHAERRDEDERALRRRKNATVALVETEAIAGAGQPRRGAGSHHHPRGCDGANYGGAFDRRLDHRFRSGHQRRRNRRRNGFHRFAALARAFSSESLPRN